MTESVRMVDGGTIGVLALDPQRERDALRELAGVQLQEGSMPPKLTVGEPVDLFASRWTLLELIAMDTPAGLAEGEGGGNHMGFHPSWLVDDGLLIALPEGREFCGRPELRKQVA